MGVLGAPGSLLGASWWRLGASWCMLGRLGPSRGRIGGALGRLGGVLDASWVASWVAKPPQHKPGLAMEREARFDSYAVALCEYLLYFSALANCKNIGGLSDSGALDRRGL